MRVLFVATPLIGHLFPMMPLALRLADSGHDVLVVTGGDAASARTGELRLESVAPPVHLPSTAARALALHPLLARRSAAGMADAHGGARVFALVNKPMVGAVTAAARRFRPDLVVHEPFAAAGAIAADRLGVPAALHNIAFDNGAELLRQILRRLGARPPASATTLSIAPPSVVSVPGRPMRHHPYATPGRDAPQWLRESPDRPRVLVTRSTMLGDGRDAMLASILRAAPHVDAEFVIVRPNRQLARDRRVPENIRLVGWIPIHTIAHTCAAMVNHGGAGSVYQGLSAGIPQLATPAPGDRAWNADLVEQRGAGLSVRARQITADHLNRLLAEPRLATAAREVATEIEGMPAVSDVAAQIAALTGA